MRDAFSNGGTFSAEETDGDTGESVENARGPRRAALGGPVPRKPNFGPEECEAPRKKSA